MKLVNLSITAAAACLFATSAHALKSEDRDVKGNMVVEYTKVPGSVDSFMDMFTEGELYGRARAHYFAWEYDDKNSGLSSTRDNDMLGLGGSMVYKTGFYKGFGATAGFYGTTQVLDDNTNPAYPNVNFGRAGKDTYRTRLDGTEGNIGVFAEAYLEYKAGKNNLKIGRQGIESVMLATNDTKMIPNTFEAAVFETKSVLPDTTLRAGYIVSQKLRDHQTFHSLIASGEIGTGVPLDRTAFNDDSGRHLGLTASNIRAKGGDVDPEMVLLTASNNSISNLKLDVEYVGLEGFVNTAIAEANYKIKINDAWTVTPGVRYLRQMDDGAGAIGGAALSGKAAAVGSPTMNSATNATRATYKDPTSADGSIIMARLVAANGPLQLHVGYSKVSDDADIIAPWRGFPTGGYTRSMAQLEWIANTENWMVKVDYDFDKAGLVPGMKVAVDYADMNFDDDKVITSGMTDRNIFHVDVWQSFKALPNTEFRLRYATIHAASTGTAGAPVNVGQRAYDEFRFEMNYLF
ncbi:MAG: OprD family outer membrane porin [Sulfuricurvum sp.]|nr:OprD family outer membrane porin [Sulfuricurvum sp.]